MNNTNAVKKLNYHINGGKRKTKRRNRKTKSKTKRRNRKTKNKSKRRRNRRSRKIKH